MSAFQEDSNSGIIWAWSFGSAHYNDNGHMQNSLSRSDCNYMYILHLQCKLGQICLWTGRPQGPVCDTLLRASQMVAMISLDCLLPKPNVELVDTVLGMNSGESGGKEEVEKRWMWGHPGKKERKMVGFPGWMEGTQICLKPLKTHPFSWVVQLCSESSFHSLCSWVWWRQWVMHALVLNGT